MTRDPETAIAQLLAECLHVRQTASLSHADRPFRALPRDTLNVALREIESVESLLHHERLCRARDEITGAAA